MRTRKAAELGLLCLVAALALRLVAYGLGTAWTAVLASLPATSSQTLGIRTLWIPVLGDLVDAAITVVGLLGALYVWRGRWELGPEFASGAGFALLMLVVGTVPLAFRVGMGLLVGFIAAPGLRLPIALLDFVGTLFLGLFLYAVVAGLPLRGARVASVVPLVLGIAGSGVLLLDRLGPRRLAGLGTDTTLGSALALVSVILWFGVYLGSWEGVRIRGAPPHPSSTPAS